MQALWTRRVYYFLRMFSVETLEYLNLNDMKAHERGGASPSRTLNRRVHEAQTISKHMVGEELPII